MQFSRDRLATIAMRFILTILAAFLAFDATAQAQSSQPKTSLDDLSPKQLALGRDLAIEMTPSQVDGTSSVRSALFELSVHGFDGKWIMIFPDDQKFSAADAIDVNVEPLRHSLEVGVAKIVPRLSGALGRIYAHAFDAQTLRAAIDFYGSADEKAVLARRDEALRQLSLLLPQAGQSGEDSLARSKLVLDQVSQAEASTPAETGVHRDTRRSRTRRPREENEKGS